MKEAYRGWVLRCAWFCHASAGGRDGYPDVTGVARAQGCDDDADLHARHAEAGDRGAESVGCRVKAAATVPAIFIMARSPPAGWGHPAYNSTPPPHSCNYGDANHPKAWPVA